MCQNSKLVKGFAFVNYWYLSMTDDAFIWLGGYVNRLCVW